MGDVKGKPTRDATVGCMSTWARTRLGEGAVSHALRQQRAVAAPAAAAGPGAVPAR